MTPKRIFYSSLVITKNRRAYGNYFMYTRHLNNFLKLGRAKNILDKINLEFFKSPGRQKEHDKILYHCVNRNIIFCFWYFLELVLCSSVSYNKYSFTMFCPILFISLLIKKKSLTLNIELQKWRSLGSFAWKKEIIFWKLALELEDLPAQFSHVHSHLKLRIFLTSKKHRRVIHEG